MEFRFPKLRRFPSWFLSFNRSLMRVVVDLQLHQALIQVLQYLVCNWLEAVDHVSDITKPDRLGRTSIRFLSDERRILVPVPTSTAVI